MSKAIIAAITSVTPIPGADKIHVAVVLGENVIVSKDTGVGYIGVFFPADTQLSEEYCKQNNLFRRSELNSDTTKSGFFDENRRVRVQPFLKVKSQGYFAPLSSLFYTGRDGYRTLGETFDTVNEFPICCKYISQATRDSIARQNRPKQAKVSVTPLFAKHVDSDQFKHNVGLIPKGALIHFHAKVHGTSHRSGLTLTNIELPKWKQVVNKFANVFPNTEYTHVVGTRNTVLTEKKDGFHGSEQFRFDVAEMLKPHMVNGMTVYGEIAGYANGKPIMAVHSAKATKDKAFQKKYGESIIYKYGCKEHEYRFHVYRITQADVNGVNIDFTQKQLDQWCADRQILGPVEVHPAIVYDGDTESLQKLVDGLTERSETLGDDVIDGSHPSEGVILRIDTGKHTPYFLKSKSYFFKVMEGICESLDREDAA
jgi:hypothetical protein